MRKLFIFSLRFARKLPALFLCLLLLSAAVFSLARCAPGDPLQSFYGDAVERMSAEEHAAARQRLGLDAPLYRQYGDWLASAARGDFGLSLKYKRPVLEVLPPLLVNTLLLGGLSYALLFVLATALAGLCALYEDSRFDRLVCRLGALACYTPSFWTGLVLLLVFSVELGWLPGGGAYEAGRSGDVVGRARHLALPLATLLLSHLWYYGHMIRNRLLDETRQDYVLLARAKGLSRRRVVFSHCLRAAAPFIVNLMAVAASHLIGGAYVVEAVFSYPGVGALAIESAKYHDYNVLLLVTLFTGAIVLLTAFAAQSVAETLDPQSKAEEAFPWKTGPTHLRP